MLIYQIYWNQVVTTFRNLFIARFSRAYESDRCTHRCSHFAEFTWQPVGAGEALWAHGQAHLVS